VRTRTRTYLIPGSGLPVRFGLSESYGRFRSPKAASRFLSDMRAALAGCERRDLSTEVSAEQRRSRTSPQADLSQWLLTTTVSPDQKVRLRIGLVRVGTYVAQVTLSPTPGADMTSGDFGWLLARAGDRLRELPSAAVGSPR
jgi:hypothetical protein